MPNKKILVIDDEPNIVKMLESRLKASSYDVVTASNGAEGLERLKKETPDLIILDVLMPVMDGFEFFKTIKKDSQKSRIPVLVLTARGAMRDTFEVFDADEFIPKPFEPEDLMTKISILFKGRALILGDNTGFIDTVKRALQIKGYEIDTVSSEEEMMKKGMEHKYKVIVAYLPSVNKEPKDFVANIHMLRSKNASIIVYSDAKVRGTETNSMVALNKIKSDWTNAKVDLFFDSRLIKDSFLQMVEELLKKL